MKDGGVDGFEVLPPRLPLVEAGAGTTILTPALPSPPIAKKAAMADVNGVGGITKPKLAWNTKNLGLRLGADLVSAASAAVLVAPVISIIDRYALPLFPPTP